MLRSRARWLLGALVVGAVLLAACGDDDDVTAASTTTTTTEADDTSADDAEGADDAEDATTDDGEDRGAAALDFFLATEADCAEFAGRVGNPVIDPSYFAGATVVVALDTGVEIEDGVGNGLIVDVDRGVVYSFDGEDQPLPREYSFGCPEDLYLGTLDEGVPDEDFGEDEAAAALEFFRSTEQLCADFAGTEIDPSYFADASVVEVLAVGVEIEDGAGNRLIVDADRGVVYSADGEDQPLPREYSFGCPEDVYLGTVEEGD